MKEINCLRVMRLLPHSLAGICFLGGREVADHEIEAGGRTLRRFQCDTSLFLWIQDQEMLESMSLRILGLLVAGK